MKLYVDLDLLQLVKIPGYSIPLTEITARRGDSIPLVVQFVQDGLVVDPGTTSAMRFDAAVAGTYGTPLVSATSFTKSGSGTGTKFTGTLTLTSSIFVATLGTATASIVLNAEITWTIAGVIQTTRPFLLTVENEIST